MTSSFNSLISIENLFQAWEEFKGGKRNKRDVQIFERNLEDNLFELHQKLKNKTYKHGPYSEFYVNDPKRRHIHKAKVADRIVHHLLYKYLYQVFDKTFIYDSYSCRLNKGTHRSVKRLEHFSRIVSKNYTQQCWALKLDIRQFFASIDHEILIRLISKKVDDEHILWLIKEVIGSYSSSDSAKNKKAYSLIFSPSHPRVCEDQILDPFDSTQGKQVENDSGGVIGIPLGNLTSQIFANIYLNELDQFIKHDLKIKYYIRYADDFLIQSSEKQQLKPSLISIGNFLQNNLKLQLHSKKVILTKLTRGIDFCGYVVLPHYILPRTRTKRRIFKKVRSKPISNQTLQSYLGYLSHASSYKERQDLKNLYWIVNSNSGLMRAST